MIKLNLNKDQKVFFTSDTHYNHTNICRGVSRWRDKNGNVPVSQTRNFNNLDQMNSTIVDNINQVVGENDILFHLGDWSFGGFDSIKEFRDRIICKNIHLILGNHDHHIENNKNEIASLFTSVSQYQVLYLEYKNRKYSFVLFHYPICSWHDMNAGRMLLHGHTHLPPDYKIGQGKSIDVGVDGNFLNPYELSEIISLLENKPIKALSLPQDHHEENLK